MVRYRNEAILGMILNILSFIGKEYMIKVNPVIAIKAMEIGATIRMMD